MRGIVNIPGRAKERFWEQVSCVRSEYNGILERLDVILGYLQQLSSE